MKKLTLALILFFCGNIYKAQNVYYSYTIEAIQKMKEEAVKNSNYSKASDLKKELDRRENEKNKILGLITEQEEKVKAEDYEAAESIKVELQFLKDRYQQKDSLRKEIEQALVHEDYNRVSELKIELKKIDKSSEEISSVPETENSRVVPNNTNETPTVKKEGAYIAKVREIQKRDPTVGFYFGNGFFADRAFFNPLVGVEFRFSRKNVFLRGFSIGVRACFENALEDGDRYSGNPNLKAGGIYTVDRYVSAGGAFTLKYYAPVPLKAVQPYIISLAGAGYFMRALTTLYWDFSTGKTVTNRIIDESALRVFVGSGIGCNFLFGRRFGAFIEAGYFRMSLINTGFVIKL